MIIERFYEGIYLCLPTDQNCSNQWRAHKQIRIARINPKSDQKTGQEVIF